jgi:hypothetical protein
VFTVLLRKAMMTGRHPMPVRHANKYQSKRVIAARTEAVRIAPSPLKEIITWSKTKSAPTK